MSKTVLLFIILLFSVELSAFKAEFFPQKRAREASEIRIKFTKPVAPIGDPLFEFNPIEKISCIDKPPRGVWEDPHLYIMKFDQPLKAGLLCKVTLRDDIVSIEGERYSGVKEFEFDTDIVTVKQIAPSPYQTIRNDQIFVFSFNGDVDIEKNIKNIFFVRTHTREIIEAILIEPSDLDMLLRNMYPYLKGGEFYGVRPKVRFADKEHVVLVFKFIRSKGGVISDVEEKYSYTVMDGFKIELNCEREKAERGCIPISNIEVNFSEPVNQEFVKQIYLADENGNRIFPKKEDEYSDVVSYVRFVGPFLPQHMYKLYIPGDIKDIYERTPENINKFPLSFKTDRIPPLAKFAADFGIVEMINGEGILPLTVRGLKGDLKIKGFGLESGVYKKEIEGRKSIFVRIWEFVKSLFKKLWVKSEKNKDEDRYLLSDIKLKRLRLSDFTPAKMFEFINSISYSDHSKGVFDRNSYSYEVNKLPDISNFAEATVLGIPIRSYGLYFFEVESEILGDILISNKDKQGGTNKAYVHSVVLVTDMAITFKRGIDTSLVFVTRLSDASPVSGAKIHVYDCKGNIYFEGFTNENGILLIDKILPDDYRLPHCAYDFESEDYYNSGYKFLSSGLIVTAHYNDDFTFVSSKWDKGIELFRFNIYEYNYSSNLVLHTVFSRNLLRAGETLHIKGFFRRKDMKDFYYARAGEMPRKIRIVHLGTQKFWEYDIKWNENGNMVFRWDIPQDAHTGHYKVYYLDCPDDESHEDCRYESDSFIVEEFKVPLIKGDLIIGDSRAGKIVVEGIFNYLMGAPANELSVSLRYRFSEDFHFSDSRYPDYNFLAGGVKEGVQRYERYNEDTNEVESDYSVVDSYDEHGRNLWQLLNLRTDNFGRFKTELPIKRTKDGRPLILHLEAGYTDPNGYFNTVTKTKTIYQSQFITGIRVKTDQRHKMITADVVVLDTARRPVKDVKVNLRLYRRIHYVHRKKVLGGYYSFEHIDEIKPQGEFCISTTDDEGRTSCKKSIESGGAYIVEVALADTKNDNSKSFAGASFYGYESEEWFEYYSDSDRTDIYPDKTDYTSNEVAKIRVVTPFEKSTALVTVEREGILDYFVTKVDAKRPFIDLKIRPEYAPNVFVSVVLLRGRVDSPPPTYLVDLAKPSFKMGITRLKVDKSKYRLEVQVFTEKKKYNVRERVKGRVEIKGLEGKDPDVMLIVVDEGLLELLDNPTYNILDGMVREKGLGINTSTGLIQVVGKRHFGKKAISTGGGGGRIATREMFDTLIYFNDSLKVKNNKADFEFTLNDSITSFRIIAIASTEKKFGHGFNKIQSTKDLFISSSLPYFAREGDSYDAEFVIKNTSNKNFNLQIAGEISFTRRGKEVSRQIIGPITAEIKPGGNQKVSLPVRVPELTDEGKYMINILSDNRIIDKISIKQKVVEASPLRVIQSSFKRFSGRLKEQFKEFAYGDNNKRVSISIMRDLGLTGRQLTSYGGFELSCLEQKVSYAVVADDKRFFNKLMDEINLYLDDNGLLKFYPTSTEGSPVLTAYILDITRLNDFELPEYVILRTTEALRNFVLGRIYRRNIYIHTTLNVEKIYALSVLAKYNDRNRSELLGQLNLDISLLSLSSLIDLSYVVEKKAEIHNAIMSYFTEKSGSYFLRSDKKNEYWWLMRSDDEAFAKTLIYLMQVNTDDTTIGKMANGLVRLFEKRGYLFNTTANAYASVALRLFAKRFNSEFHKSILSVHLDCSYFTETVDESFGEKTFLFDIVGSNIIGGEILPDCPITNRGTLTLEDKKNSYWVKTTIMNRVNLSEPVFKGFRIKKEYLDENNQIKGVFKQSDLVKIRLTIEFDSYYNNVVLIDPIVTGAQVLGRISKEWGQYENVVWDYTYSDIRDGYNRTYYEYVYGNKIIFEYSIRLNTRGRFNLPPTRVELMYMPDVYGELPNDPVVVQ
ncbi:MAG: MG2 domain-containing protein [Deltaproteobacteria bacterium]|nr:MG2 domain-containing protein [Deltaproteobacteria bacterium]